MYLVDTSAWILHFKKDSDFDLRSVCLPEDRILCLPVYQEILQGIRTESEFRIIRNLLQAGVFIEDPLTRAVYDEAVDLYRLSRKHGFTLRSSVDCIIAACAIRHDVVVVHRDRDYTSLAKISVCRQMPI